MKYTLLFMLLVFTSKIQAQNPVLDSILNLSASSSIEYEYDIHKVIRLANNFKEIQVVHYYDCYGDVCSEVKSGLISPDSDTLRPVLDDIMIFKNGNMMLNFEGNFFHVTKNYEFIREYEYFDTFYGNRAVFKSEDSYGLMDDAGKIILEPEYDFIVNRDGNKRIALLNDQIWEIINMDSISESNSDNGWGFETIKQNEPLKVKKSETGLWAIIDPNGNQLTDYAYNQVWFWSMHPGGKVRRNQYWAVLDRNFKEVTDFIYDDIVEFGGPVLLVKQGLIYPTYGLIGFDGRSITDKKFSSITKRPVESMKIGHYWVAKEMKGKWGLIDNHGKILAPFKYDEINLDEIDQPRGKMNDQWELLIKE